MSDPWSKHQQPSLAAIAAAYKRALSEPARARSAIERIRDHGLAINSCIRDGVRLYYVSIDARAPDEDPSDEQVLHTHFRTTPQKAAEVYIRENPDHFDN